MAIPADPLLANQWHLIQTTPGLLDLSVFGAWDVGYTGLGVDVFVIDDAFDYNHGDLFPNYDQTLDFDFREFDADPFGDPFDAHGTAVMGIIGADDNGSGAVGVAFDSTIAGYRVDAFIGDFWLGNIRDAINGTVSEDADVVNISQGMANAVATVFGGQLDQTLVAEVRLAIGNAVDNGRGGLGAIITKSAGNSRDTNYDVNGDMWTNDTRQVVVAAVDQNGFVSSYSSYGAANLVSAFGTPGEVLTTDRTGGDGYDFGDFTPFFNGTSAAAPMVAGVVSLIIIDANENLGWRDIQDILAYSARHVGSDVGGSISGFEREPWFFNGADTWNGGGLHYSTDYGFGLVDATAATRLAESWLLTHAARTSANQLTTFEDALSGTTVIPDGDILGTTVNITETDSIEVERVSLTVTFATTYITDVQIFLTSPNGTVSTLVQNIVLGTTEQGNNFNGTWTFESQAFRGEMSDGTWQVRIVDAFTLDTLEVSDLGLRTFGSVSSNTDRYVFTDEYSDYDGLFGHATSINGDPFDVVNAAAVSTGSTIRLTDGETSTIDGVDISFNGFWDAIGGDGNDLIMGNDSDNWLWGMRGSDTIYGGGGIDDMYGGAGNDHYVVDQAGDRIIETAGDGAADVVYANAFFALRTGDEIEVLRTASIAATTPINLTGNEFKQTLLGNAGANVLNGLGGADTLQGYAGNDSYVVDQVGDRIIETAGNGANDAVYTMVNYLLRSGDDIELLRASDVNATTALNLTGSELAQNLLGTAGVNILNGGGGADIMRGYAGDDTYHVDEGGDYAIEAVGAGANDQVHASASYVLRAGNEVEVLRTVDLAAATAINLTGNEFDQTLFGNAGVNTLNGKAGDDTLRGFAGDDTFVFNEGEANGDFVVDFAGNGALSGDRLQFVGYGAGATFAKIDATHGEITYDGGASTEIITFTNAAAVHTSDVFFV